MPNNEKERPPVGSKANKQQEDAFIGNAAIIKALGGSTCVPDGGKAFSACQEAKYEHQRKIVETCGNTLRGNLTIVDYVPSGDFSVSMPKAVHENFEKCVKSVR